MIKAVITNGILKQLTVIEENRFCVANVELPVMVMNKQT